MAVELTTIPAQAGELVRMLLTAGEGGENTSNRNWYRQSADVGSVSSDSDVEISAGLGSINRIQWHLSNSLRFFKSGSGLMSTAIAAGGDLAGRSFLLAFDETSPPIRFGVGGASVTAIGANVRLAADAGGIQRGVRWRSDQHRDR